jgi:teichuronic acid biosynthesis glycosyltransferase TuaC
MKILIVSSGNSGKISPFVREQVNAVTNSVFVFDYYIIKGKGIIGYLYNLIPLHRKLKSYEPDLIHAHYGLSGLLALLTIRTVPLITTFHGNDINPKYPLSPNKTNWNLLLSKLVYLRSNASIFVSDELAERLRAKGNRFYIIPCHVNLDVFYPINRSDAKKRMNLSLNKRYILFSSSFHSYIKNYPLALKACNNFDNLELLELDGYSREEVNFLLNACEIALITSYNEGSSQFLKEAMACNCPVVSTKVGDSEMLLRDIDGCYLTSFDEIDVKNKIEFALEFRSRFNFTGARSKLIQLGLDATSIAKKIATVYKSIAEA